MKVEKKKTKIRYIFGKREEMEKNCKDGRIEGKNVSRRKKNKK